MFCILACIKEVTLNVKTRQIVLAKTTLGGWFMRSKWLITSVIVTSLVCLAFGIIFWGSTSQPLRRTATTEIDGTQIRVETDKKIYVIGEPVRITFFQKNLLTEPITKGTGLGHVEADILNSNGQLVFGRWGVFSNWDTDIKIMPLEEVEISIFSPWSQIDNDLRQVPFGKYTIRIYFQKTTVELLIAIV